MRTAHSKSKISTVFVVDGDARVRDAIQVLLSSVGHTVETFRSAEEFMDRRDSAQPGCLVVDARLPETSGLQLQKILLASNDRIPIIFVTAYGDVVMSVQAMKAGAIDFLMKPYREQDLLEAVQAGLQRDRARRQEEEALARDLANYQSLTEREREIMRHVVTGQINKQTAAATGLSDVTVKVHRAHVMRKMGTASLADLVRVADKLAALLEYRSDFAI